MLVGSALGLASGTVLGVITGSVTALFLPYITKSEKFGVVNWIYPLLYIVSSVPTILPFFTCATLYMSYVVLIGILILYSPSFTVTSVPVLSVIYISNAFIYSYVST